ncbi:LAS1 (YKR063C) [Zygosaccharomyces parabailii]|nr:LAS1 (YKR063C) [Zygosaccharomyces parabailii]
MVQPRIVPWAHENELQDLKNWFYNDGSREDMRFRAVQKVKSYQSKGTQYLPHVIDSTAQITSSVLLDEEKSACDKFSVKLSYTMSLIRFVNGLLDPTQQSQFAIPLHTLAKRVGLPSWFVDLRHWGTHERELPSLEMLRIAAKEALAWLWEHYWNDDELEEEEVSDEEENEVVEEVRQLMRMGKSIKAILAENSQHWEEGSVGLITSSNFKIEESKPKRRGDLSPQEQIDAFVSRCRDVWKLQDDRQLFVEVCIEEYNSVLIRLMITKLSEFDQEIICWLLRNYQDKLHATSPTTLSKKFPLWNVLERRLLNKIVTSINLKSLAQKWEAWNNLFLKHPCYLALWLCQALANRVVEDRIGFKKRRSKRRKQEPLQEVEFALFRQIDRLSQQYDDEPQLYDKMPRPVLLETSAQSDMNDILGDLASLKERLQFTKPSKILWDKHTQWQPKPFGTL